VVTPVNTLPPLNVSPVNPDPSPTKLDAVTTPVKFAVVPAIPATFILGTPDKPPALLAVPVRSP